MDLLRRLNERTASATRWHRLHRRHFGLKGAEVLSNDFRLQSMPHTVMTSIRLYRWIRYDTPCTFHTAK